jgi:hypothetical protein
MSYGEAAAKLNSSVGAVRKRALRGHWARQAGNDGKARILVPDETSMGRPTPVRVDAVSTVSALQAHIETLKTELAASEARVDKLSADLAGERAEHQEQLAAAMAQLVELSRRMATIAEQAAAKSVEAEPGPPRRKLGQAWRWFMRN